ncbi:hypothetical protein AVEN_68624-1 [Araneus ventricosus]|uniref:Uncharacterized protein n=1 Tax=Araneus ventricosus TaxID=182803 RepID=A0A4Y2WJ75_ARAVE|nr:hypothetical protein AVEN_68624-1 [Araneus ventricosus]
MGKAEFFSAGVFVAPIIWMWIKIFLFHEAAYLISLGVYLFLIIVLAHELLGNKASRMDKAVQTDENRMKDASVQTEDFSILTSEEDTEDSEMTSDLSYFRKDDQPVTTGIHAMEDELNETGEEESSSEIPAKADELAETEDEESSSETHAIGDELVESEVEESSSEIHAKADELAETEDEESPSEIEIDPDSPALPTPKLDPFPYTATFLGAKVKKTKFLVPKDPNLFIDDAVPVIGHEVVEWYNQYIKEKHEEKKLSFFQRKMRKIKKSFKKK